jgi:hypothetical protein
MELARNGTTVQPMLILYFKVDGVEATNSLLAASVSLDSEVQRSRLCRRKKGVLQNVTGIK